MIIREAIISDANGIAKVHINTWKTTYKGMVSDKFLNSLSHDDRTIRWSKVIKDFEKENKYIFVAEDPLEGIK